MIDHSIILQILYHKTMERQVYSTKTKKECANDGSMIFFPVQEDNYSTKLNNLNSLQYMQRLTLLYSMIWKTN
jgi:hypothetical protein